MSRENGILRKNLAYLLSTLKYGENIIFTEAIGISPSTLTKWKQGKHLPDTHDKRLIAEYFGITTDVLMNKEL